MDIKTFLDNIYEHVCCSVCTNRFTNPKLLPCLHTFCLHCLQRIQATSGIRDNVLCPECRRNFTIPRNGGLDTLPTNLPLNSLLDALPVTQCETSGVKCGNCDKTREQSAYCFTCCFDVVRSGAMTAFLSITAIEAKKNEIFDEVEMKEKQRLERLGEKRQEIEEEMKKDQTAIEKSHMILKRSTSAQIMQPNDLVDELFREEGEQEDPVDLDGEHAMDFVFERNEELFNDVHAKKLGFLKRKCNPKELTVEGKGISEGTVRLKAEIVVKTRNILGEQVYDQNNQVTMEIRNHEGHDCSTKPQIHDDKDGSYEISYFAKESGTCQASVKVNGQHVRGSPLITELKPRLFKPELSFGKQGSTDGMFYWPWGLAVNDKDEIAGQFNLPAGIIVSDLFNRGVQIFDDEGHYLDQFGEELGRANGLSIDSDGNFIVADRTNKSIKIFSLDGRFLCRIGEEGSFINPFHCIHHKNYFFVLDCGVHCVKVFDKQGKFLYQFGGRGAGDGDFYEPGCLSVDRVGHLFVCDSMNHRVQVFKLNGEFVTKFGELGEGRGKLNKPISTAILRNGRVIVTEFGNHRVQVFE
ncbi:tripartite motif-containing protein 2-like [Montipora foliosa]|uniref:tripartite motif-containing protein 2-like n=1 Tax=Montipora foliosa TaxID=591990 RepID=UPI0035F10455